MRKKEPNPWGYYVLIVAAIALLSAIFLPESNKPIEPGPCYYGRYDC
jgi:hypothetical protein